MAHESERSRFALPAAMASASGAFALRRVRRRHSVRRPRKRAVENARTSASIGASLQALANGAGLADTKPVALAIQRRTPHRKGFDLAPNEQGRRATASRNYRQHAAGDALIPEAQYPDSAWGGFLRLPDKSAARAVQDPWRRVRLEMP